MSSDDRSDAPAYDAVAREYADMNEASPYNAYYERPAVQDLLGDVGGLRVLDVGCGSGPLSRWLVERGATVTGIDVSPRMIELAREQVPAGAEFRVADLERPLDFLPDKSVDVAVASLVLHYLRDWEASLRELHRVLVPDGRLVISTHHPFWDLALSPTGNYFALERVHDSWPLAETTFEVSFWRRPLNAMVRAFRDSGFDVEVLSEPMPLPECRDLYPDAWDDLTTSPTFVFFRLRARAAIAPGSGSA